MPYLPGLVRYDEVLSGEIKHALTMTVNYTQSSLLWPARHFTYQGVGNNFPPMGARFRLKASVDISGFHPQVQVFLKALKTYGAFLIDNGGPFFFSGVPDSRWDDTIWVQLHSLHGRDLEVVDESSLMIDPNSAAVRSTAPTVSISSQPASATLQAGQSLQFTAAVVGTSNTAVTWTVSPSSAGSISSSGLYTAPANAGSNLNVTVTATALADPSKTAVSTITVTPSAAVSITIVPENITLTNGQSHQFVANIVDPLNLGTTWGIVSGPGTISGGGFYTAPAHIASRQTVEIISVTRNQWKLARAYVTLIPGASVSLTGLSLTPATVTAGGAVTGTVHLSGAAGTNLSVALASSNTMAAPVPASVTVPAGSSTASFTFLTNSVGAVTTPTISASLAGGTVASPLTINPVPAAAGPEFASVWLSTTSIARGDTAAVVLQLKSPAWGGAHIPISSSNPAMASVPASTWVNNGWVIGVALIYTKPGSATGPVTITVGTGPTAKSVVLNVY
jgi:hypothetical protein